MNRSFVTRLLLPALAVFAASAPAVAHGSGVLQSAEAMSDANGQVWLSQADKKPVINMAELDRARSKKDLDYLDKACEGKEVTIGKFMQKSACKWAMELRPFDYAKADCKTVAKDFLDRGTTKRDVARKAAERVVECKEFTALFESIVQWGQNNDGALFLKEFEDKKVPVEKEWKTYLKKHQGKKFFALKKDAHVEFGLKHIGKWLLTKKKSSYCKDIAKASLKSSELARVSLVPYFEEAKCKQGTKVVASLLKSKSVEKRLKACKAMGTIGKKKDKKAVLKVAKTDGHSVVKDGVKVYPVRDACLEASGRI